MNEIRWLPKEISLMLVRGIVLLPQARLSIPLDNDTYVPFFLDVLKGDGYLGVVQPCALDYNHQSTAPIYASGEYSFFEVGTLGKVMDIARSDDGKPYVIMSGVCRFKIKKFTPSEKSIFPSAEVDYHLFDDDLTLRADFQFDRSRLISILKPLFERWEIAPEWNDLFADASPTMINNIIMACPLVPEEKQAVLQEQTIKDQSNLFMNLMEMSSFMPKYDQTSIH